MQQKQTAIYNEKEAANPAEHSMEKRMLGVMILIAAFTTAVFIVHSIINSTMNYQSWRAPFWSYFTIQSNMIVCVWFAVAGLNMLGFRREFGWSLNMNLSAVVTTYIFVTGIIYWGVLVPMFAGGSDSMWMFSASNIWMHTTTPVVCYLLHRYARAKSGVQKPKLNLVYFYLYPAAYVVMALGFAVRGVYIYPMFNAKILGWGGVAGCLFGMLIVFTVLYVVLLRRKTRKVKFTKSEVLGVGK